MKKIRPTTEQRRAFVMSMRDSGLSYEQIAAEAIKKFGKATLPKGYGRRLACLDLKRELGKKPRSTLKTDMRRRKVYEYRMTGLTFHQIVTKLEAELGKPELPANYSERDACRDLKRYQEKMDTKDRQEMIKSRSLNRERLNFLLTVVWEKASQGDYHAIDRTLKIIEALARLDGIDVVPRSAASADDLLVNSFAEISEHFSKLNGKGNGNGKNEE